MKEVTIEQLLEFRNIYHELNDFEVCLSTAIKYIGSVFEILNTTIDS